MTADATPGHAASTDGLGHNLRSQHKVFAHWFLGQRAKTALVSGDVAWEAWKTATALERERNSVLTDDMLRYAMAALGTGSPAEAERFRAFWLHAMTARDTRA